MPSSPAPQPSWKQEVNRRLAEHKNRKGISVVDQNVSEGSHGSVNSRAAAAAARVAERYAKAPSYSDMQAAEARAALRAAEAATRVALQAQAAAQAALENLEASDEEYKIEAYEYQTASPRIEEPERRQAWENPALEPAQSLEIKWEPDMPVHRGAPEQANAQSEPSTWWAFSHTGQDDRNDEQMIEQVEGARPIHANLIEFPRELIATRRIRPRLTESLNPAAEPCGQLSIFEVDPTTISIDPAIPDDQTHTPSWSGREWKAIELDERRDSMPEYYYQPAAETAMLHQAPFSRRIMATMVDVALILGVVCAIAAFLASRLHHLPGMRASEILAVVTLAVVTVLYQVLFLLYAKCTPGMRYAEIALCTFDDEYPTRAQMKTRLVAMLLSLLPMGLGMLWAIFDEDSLSWHDRHSRTYLRMS